MKIGIVGARVRNTDEDFKILTDFILDFINKTDDDIEFVSGGASKGADHFAEILANELDIPITIHYPNKSKLPENSNRMDYAKICYERNTLIAKDSDILIALVKPERKGGTEYTIKKFKKIKNKDAILL